MSPRARRRPGHQPLMKFWSKEAASIPPPCPSSFHHRTGSTWATEDGLLPKHSEPSPDLAPTWNQRFTGTMGKEEKTRSLSAKSRLWSVPQCKPPSLFGQ
ncbi:hypothetical protein VULLAG_LOCUS17983 [Vulpes lagopus]